MKKLLLKTEFRNISTCTFSYYDNEDKHWHKILEATAMLAKKLKIVELKIVELKI
ncbi:MAG: hypothetical protein QME57_03135 [Patescibacteria group bacterium]|nr:hypothetical protein [Patescibacteria group bacterium]